MGYLLFFFVEVLFLFRVEKTMWGKYITPLNMLMLPFVFATFVAIIYPLIDGDIPHYYLPSLVLWMFGLVLFEIPSCILAYQFNRQRNYQLFIIKEGKYDDFYVVLKYIAYFCILLSLLKLGSLSSQMDSFGTDEFSEQYQSKGIFAHLSVLLSAIFSYAIYKLDRNHKSAIIIVAGALIGMYAVGTKSWIIAPVFIGYLARLLSGRTKITLKNLLFPIILATFLFFFSYYLIIVVSLNNELDSDLMIYLVNHFIDYFCSGSLTLSIDYRLGFIEPDMTDALFGPIINIFNALFGLEYVKVINPVFIDIGTLGASNVRTFFGTIYAYSHSVFVLVLMTLLFSFITNLIYAYARKSKSIFLSLANCSNLVFLALGFFEFYWLNLSCYELFFLFLIMHFFLNRQYRVQKI